MLTLHAAHLTELHNRIVWALAPRELTPPAVAYHRARGQPVRIQEDGTSAASGLSAASGMIAGMTTTKIAVSLPTGLVQRARRAVRSGRSASVSAYIASAVEEKATLEDLATLLREMLAKSGGPLTEVERRQADEALGLARPKARRRS